MKIKTQENIENKLTLNKRFKVTYAALSALGGGLIGIGISDAAIKKYSHNKATNQLTELYAPRPVPEFIKEENPKPDYTNEMNKTAAGLLVWGLGFAVARKSSQVEDELKNLENQPYKHL